MKKIGILTYHRVFNFGSLLQTYALQKYLENKGQMVEVIDYYPERLQKKKLLFHVSAKWRRPIWKMIAHLIPAVITRLMGYHMMDTFLAKYVHLTNRVYENEEDLGKNCPIYDIYLNGSDQVWNVETADGLVDKVFFMAFLPEKCVRAAYAGSFGKDSFSDESLIEIKKYLSKYSAISVRENSGLNILDQIGIKGGQWVLDPTFLLKPAQWKEIETKIKLPERYLLVYNLNRNTRITRLAQQIANERGLQIVNFAHSFVFIKGAKNIIYPTPNLFITLFENAEYVVTDSFHGTAFSISFGRQFICVPAPRFNSRLSSILELIGESDRLLQEEDNFEIINRKIDYTKVEEILEIERQKADKFIDDIINL